MIRIPTIPGFPAPARAGRPASPGRSPSKEGSLRTELGLWLRQLGRSRLETEFDSIHARLGTPNELPDDVGCAKAISQELNLLLRRSAGIRRGPLADPGPPAAAPRLRVDSHPK